MVLTTDYQKVISFRQPNRKCKVLTNMLGKHYPENHDGSESGDALYFRMELVIGAWLLTDRSSLKQAGNFWPR